ncbi:triple tyrosine motif-containing protein [Pedobacter gandavensis]|uniref:ligand-binding sensor domain-containing protein n=1 Tax=Pedobacter gandavensis TaxID=2679963 RepID=UPI00293087F4|nr:triple tyrosine motif-containing protein [Pedobacter gandavensis]
MKTSQRRYLILYFLFAFISVAVKANDIRSIGVPYVQNYPKSLYLSGNQNWSITKDKNGVLYFGNAQGLLSYDGKYWQQYKLPNRQIVRSVLADPSGIIYTGGFGELGYWSYKNDKLTYSSLTKLIPRNNPVKDEIWKICSDGKRVIFQSFSTIYIYENNKIKAITASKPFLFLHQVGKRFLVEVLGSGLFELKADQLIALKGSNPTNSTDVLSILPYQGNKLLIGTSKDGLFLYDGEKFSTFNTPANSFLKTFHLNNGVKVLNKYYAYGTILNGLIIIDEQGNVVQQINKSSGLQNNTVLSLYADQDQNLWAGLDNGIDRIELNSPLYFYFDKTGQFGTVYSSLIYNNTIYLGTNQGLFYSPWVSGKQNTFNSFDFKLIPNSQGQVWELTVIDGQLICGHNNGTFNVTGNKLEKISNANGGWTIKKLDDGQDCLIQGTYNGLVIYKKDARGLWRFNNKVANFDAPSRYVERDEKGDIWVSHAYKGLYKLTLSPDLSKVIATRTYNEKNGLPDDYNINIFKIENNLVFSSDKGFYIYDDISNRFKNYEELNKGLKGFSTANKIINAGKSKYWFINRGKMALVQLKESGQLQIDSNRFNILDGRMVQYYENISKISDNIYLISVDDGFVIYNGNNVPANLKTQDLPVVLIRKIEDITDTYQLLSEIGEPGIKMEIPYSRNNIRISYALPYYRQAKIKFQYFLEGYSKQWSEWSTASQKDFTNLSKGNYTFRVRAKINDQVIPKESTFEFQVLPPFYATNWALALYTLCGIALIIAAKRLYELKLKRDQDAITKKMQAEKEVFLKKEAEANERQIIKLQTEKLQVELAGKNRELANSAMSLVYKNELLQKLSQEIAKLKDGNGKPLSEDQLRKIQKVIDEGMNDERDWHLFESSFNEAHESFFKKLKANHPDLVPNDLKLCAYLHMNMSSKEMASLLNISLRGVEIRRYRLRKKLEIPHDKNLVEFLMEL